MAQEILMASAESESAEIKQITTFEEVETSGEAKQARKRHRRDILPIEAFTQARETQGAVRPAKKGRR
jgi:hypothetical protein